MNTANYSKTLEQRGYRMHKGVLLYCFDTPKVKYHKLALKCIQQIEKYLKLPVRIVTDDETHRHLPWNKGYSYKIIRQQKQNFRYYNQKKLEWRNHGRSNALDDTPFDITLLIDIDYFCFTDNLLQLMDTEYDFLCHDSIFDVSGQNKIMTPHESSLPLVWATCCVFKKTEETKKLFDMIKTVEQHYEHYRNLYRIKHPNFRNDFAFAIALHQLGGFVSTKNKIPNALATLSLNNKVLEMTGEKIVFKYNNKINELTNQDVHVLDKEFIDE